MSYYFEREDLQKFGAGYLGENAPELWNNFMKYYGSVFQEGSLTTREKDLIALAVAHAVHCPYCIDAYTTACLEAGCDQEEMTEAVHVASAITGGAVLAYGIQMKSQADKLEL